MAFSITLTASPTGGRAYYYKGLNGATLTATFNQVINRYVIFANNAIIASGGAATSSLTYTDPVVTGNSITYEIQVLYQDDNDEFVTGIAQTTISILTYNPPTIEINACYRCDSNGNRAVNGECIYIDATITPSTGFTLQSTTIRSYYIDNNLDEVNVEYFTALNYGSISQVLNGATYSTSQEYHVEIWTGDTYPTTYIAGATVYTSQRTINAKVSGDGVAFGKKATKSEVVDSAWAIHSDNAFFSNANNENKARGLALSYDGGANVDALVYAQRNSITYNGTTTWFPRRWMFNVYSRNATTGARLAYNELYRLPEADYGLGGNATYDILTTKYLTSATLSSGSWSSKTQSITVTGVTSSNTVIVCAAPSSMSAYQAAGVYCSAQGTNSLTFTCTTTPTSNLTVNILVVG